MATHMQPICIACAHLERKIQPGRERAKCKAYPGGIPDKIYQGGFDHREPYKGDNGIQFELKAGEVYQLRNYEEGRATMETLLGRTS